MPDLSNYYQMSFDSLNSNNPAYASFEVAYKKHPTIITTLHIPHSSLLLLPLLPEYPDIHVVYVRKDYVEVYNLFEWVQTDDPSSLIRLA